MSWFTFVIVAALVAALAAQTHFLERWKHRAKLFESWALKLEQEGVGRERCGVHFHRDAAALIEDGYMTSGAYPRLTPFGERELEECNVHVKNG